MSCIDKLKDLNLDRLLSLDEAVFLSGEARQGASEFEALGLPVPEWLEKSTGILREEIARRTHAADMERLKSLGNQLESLKTAAERRAELQKQVAALQRKMGLSPAGAR